jgi:predicted ATPase
VSFAPLTVVVGKNSSGKSSLIQSILVLTQAQRYMPKEAVVSLNGPLVQLGEFQEVRSEGATKQENVEIAGTFQFRRIPGESREPFTIDWTIRLSGRTRVGLRGTARICGVEARVETEDRRTVIKMGEQTETRRQDKKAYDHGLRLSPYAGPPHLTGFHGSLAVEDPAETLGSEAPEELYGVLLRGAFPIGALVARDDFEQAVYGLIERSYSLQREPFDLLLLDEANRRFVVEYKRRPSSHPHSMRSAWRRGSREVAAKPFDDEDLQMLADGVADALDRSRGAKRPMRLPAEVKRLLDDRAFGQDDVTNLLVRLQGLISEPERVLVPARAAWVDELRSAAASATRFLERQVWYLGPLREEPARVSRSAPTGSPMDVGTRGEFVASVLQAFAKVRIRRPPVIPGDDRAPDRLELAVNYWAEWLGIAKAVTAEDLARLGVLLRITPVDLDRAVHLPNVGVGVSQLLPVLVVCLLAEPGSLVLLEQPELHLHPAVQQRLGDFLLACARTGRQIVVESHSDALVNRLRLRTAEDESDSTLNTFSLLFAKLINGETQFEKVPVNRYGSLDVWPDGFFDEEAEDAEAILEHGTEKMRAEASEQRD